MNRRLFRFTPHGEQPRNYTDSLRSASAGNATTEAALLRLEPGDRAAFANGTWERIV